MQKVVVITGTPGTGKTTLARKLHKKLRCTLLISANDLIKERHLFSGLDPKDGAMLVKTKALENEINKIVKKQKKNIIIEGHVLCEIKVRGATAIVLRGHLFTVMKRLKKRKYKIGKLTDNLISEAIDYCGEHSEINYKKAFEIFGGKGAFEESLKIINGKNKKAERIDLLSELPQIIKVNKNFTTEINRELE